LDDAEELDEEFDDEVAVDDEELLLGLDGGVGFWHWNV
jgi:hypothetical protein